MRTAKRAGILALLLAAWAGALAAHAADTRDAGRFFTLSTGDLRAEAAEARAAGRKALLLVFEQEGCPGCIHMHRAVYNQAGVQDYYGRHYTALAIDIFGAVALRDFSGREHTEKSYAQALKVRATPTFIFYDLSGNELVRHTGTLRTPGEFLLLGEYVASGAYRNRGFERFKSDNLPGKGS